MKLSEGLERLAEEALTMDRDELSMRILGASVQAKELAQEVERLKRHPTQVEFTAACERADAAEFLLIDLNNLLNELPGKARVWLSRWAAAPDDSPDYGPVDGLVEFLQQEIIKVRGLNQIGTSSGRTSSAGPNLANIPRGEDE